MVSGLLIDGRDPVEIDERTGGGEAGEHHVAEVDDIGGATRGGGGDELAFDRHERDVDPDDLDAGMVGLERVDAGLNVFGEGRAEGDRPEFDALGIVVFTRRDEQQAEQAHQQRDGRRR